MIRVKVDLISANSRDRDREMGTIYIANDGTGDDKTGNYIVTLIMNGRKHRPVEIKGFKRKQHSWVKLLRAALLQLTGEEK